MENKINSESNSNSNSNFYEKISNSWKIIFDFLDINSLLQIETASKFFRNQMLLFYGTKENIAKINKIGANVTNDDKIKLFKKQFLSKYFNLFVHINISDIKLCNIPNINKPENEEKFEFPKIFYPQTESIFFKNRNQIEQISMQDNKFLILYNTNKFSILEFDVANTAKKFNEIYSYDFANAIINNFTYFDNTNEKYIFFIRENSLDFYILNLKEKDIKIYDLKKDFDIFNEENLVIKKVYTINDFLLFLTNKDEFILIPNEQLKISKNKSNNKKVNSDSDEDKKSEEDEKNENKEEKIVYPKKLENNYGSIKYIYSNSSNVILLNNEYQLYSIPMPDYKNYENQIPKFKLFSEQKFPNFYTMGGYNNYFILLEKEKIKPLEEWSTEEVYKWFEEMELDDYLNMVKYQKITGKNIVEGGKDYLIDFMGVQEEHINKIYYEMNTLKFETNKDKKLWGWGNNKNGQLGLINGQNFIKTPTQINMPNMLPDDSIEKIYCGKTYSVLLTKFGNIFVTGNYSSKDNKEKEKPNNQEKKNKGKNKQNKDGHKEKGKKGEKNKEKDKNKNKDNENNTNNNLAENKWLNISQNICYCRYNLFKNSKKNQNNETYFKAKDIFCQDKIIYFIGFYSNTIPFFAIQRRPKFKHAKKGAKFITSDKVIEHIQEFLKDKMSSFTIVYGDSLLKMLETDLDDYLQSEIPFHKIIQIKENNEVIWDRKKRYFKENFIKKNINK